MDNTFKTTKVFRKLLWTIIFFVLSLVYSEVPLNAQNEIVNVDSKGNTILNGKQSDDELIQSYYKVSGDRLKHRTTHQMGELLSGTLPGLQVNLGVLPNSQVSYNLQRSGQPIVLVDGIPRSMVNIPVDQIESITVQRDALGTAMLGMLGGNGVINVITKKGKEGRLKIGFTSQFAWNKQMHLPKLLDSYDYASLYNQARTLSGESELYTQEDLDKYQNQSSPYTHPDVDWYDKLLKPSTFTHQYNVNLSGGSKVVRYFVDLNVFNQDGFLREDKSINSYSTQEAYEKYSLRSKLNINVTDNTLLDLNIFGQMMKDNVPGAFLGTMYKNLYNTPRNAYPMFNPDGSLGGNLDYKDNIYGQSIHSGYYTFNASDFNFDIKLTHSFKGLFEGLYASLLYSYNSIYRESIDRSKNFAVYEYNPSLLKPYTKLSETTQQKNTYSYDKTNRMMYYELALGYNYSKDMHTTSNIVQFGYNNYLVRNNLPFNNSGVSGRSQYNYDQKYFAEVSWSVMKMNQFKSGHRTGFFPAAGVAWLISNEPWFSDDSFVNQLKLRTSFGVVGNNFGADYYNSAVGVPSYYYDYLGYYNSAGTLNVGTNGTGNSTLKEAALPVLTTWERQQKLNIGLDGSLFDSKLLLTLEYYRNLYSDILMNRMGNASSMIGVDIAKENIGKTRYMGINFDATYSDVKGDFLWSVNTNLSLNKSKRTFLGEFDRPESYMRRTGTPEGQHFGYISEGFFNSQEEIDEYLNHTTIEGYSPMPGDLKYRDINKDGIIDSRDITSIGKTKPFISYGLYAQLNWKGIGLEMQWMGIANNKIYIAEVPFEQQSKGVYGQALKEHLDSWSYSNTNASYPRPTIGGNDYNQSKSTFWLRNNNFFRMKHLEVSYELPMKWVSAMRLNKIKLFATGYNLLTFATLKDRDPESWSYTAMPNMKSYSFGVNIQF